uniref:Ribosomal protein L13 n=1 Tax=Rhodogorgon sp. TaxID=2485824 RepID=A0A3G3MHV1_9FLOR|nr:ribosomal protein L13 [Rhodogorgon sp.]
MNKTYIPIKNLEIKWYIIDAKNQTLGRLSTYIATVLRGKNKPTYAPYHLNKSYVIVINAERITITGAKNHQKMYRQHSGRPGGLKVETFRQLKERIPTRIIEKSVKGMLPKGSLGRRLFTHLKVYCGPSHPHNAQAPINLLIDSYNKL